MRRGVRSQSCARSHPRRAAASGSGAGAGGRRPALPLVRSANTAPVTGTPVNGGTCRRRWPATPTTSTRRSRYTNEAWEMLEATNDGLVTFKTAAGGAGQRDRP